MRWERAQTVRQSRRLHTRLSQPLRLCTLCIKPHTGPGTSLCRREHKGRARPACCSRCWRAAVPYDALQRRGEPLGRTRATARQARLPLTMVVRARA